MHPEHVEQGVVHGVVAGQRLAMGGHRLASSPAGPDLERDHRYVASLRLGEGTSEPVGIAHSLEEQGEHPRGFQPEGPVHVVVHCRVDLQTRGHDEVEVDPATVVQHGREERAGVAEEGDPSRLQRLGLVEPADPDPVLDVEPMPFPPQIGIPASDASAPSRLRRVPPSADSPTQLA